VVQCIGCATEPPSFGDPRATAPTRCPASLSQEAEVNLVRSAPLGLSLWRLERLAFRSRDHQARERYRSPRWCPSLLALAIPAAAAGRRSPMSFLFRSEAWRRRTRTGAPPRSTENTVSLSVRAVAGVPDDVQRATGRRSCHWYPHPRDPLASQLASPEICTRRPLAPPSGPALTASSWLLNIAPRCGSGCGYGQGARLRRH
jgi:hypothetical protein